MKLLEYDANNFLTSNMYKKDRIKKCTDNGFMFGMLEFFKQDFWLIPGTEYSDEDFIKEVYRQNIETKTMSESSLIESLSRFLCGYEIAQICGQNIQNEPESEQRKAFQNERDLVQGKVTDTKIKEKAKLVNNIIKEISKF